MGFQYVPPLLIRRITVLVLWGTRLENFLMERVSVSVENRVKRLEVKRFCSVQCEVHQHAPPFGKGSFTRQ